MVKEQVEQPAMGIPMNQAQNAGPQTMYQTPGGEGQWSTGLCDCGSDISHCCLTCWCPCITFGQNAEIIDKGSSSCGVSGALYSLIMVFTGCQYIYSCTYRTKMRQEYAIPGDGCIDCCTHFWCEPCALCQETRELQHRGYDVSLGWHGNMQRQNQGAGMATAPTVPGSMVR